MDDIVHPVLVYSFRIPNRQTILAISVQQFYSLWGEEARSDISWSKLQCYYVKAWPKRFWTLLLPEMYFDHLLGGASMDIEGTAHYRATRRITLWLKVGTGLFREHPAVYEWTAEGGLRYLMFRRKAS
jgi:hypothetical protein